MIKIIPIQANNCLMEPGFESMSSQKTSAAHVIKLEKKPTLSTIPQISNDASTPPLLYDLYTHPESSNDINNLHMPFNYYKPDLDSLNSVFSSVLQK